MPWDNDADQFSSPDYDFAPLAYYAQNALELIAAEQTRAITWWNTRWSSRLNFTLQALDAKQMHVGRPTTFSSRALHCIPSGEIIEKDNYEEVRSNFTFVYIPGSPQLSGAAAGRYSTVYVASFYLAMYESILQSAPTTKLTTNWPAAGRAADITSKLVRLDRPDTKLFQELVPENGIESIITMDLLINPYSLQPF